MYINSKCDKNRINGELVKTELSIKHDSANIVGNIVCKQPNRGLDLKAGVNLTVDNSKCSSELGYSVIFVVTGIY